MEAIGKQFTTDCKIKPLSPYAAWCFRLRTATRAVPLEIGLLCSEDKMCRHLLTLNNAAIP